MFGNNNKLDTDWLSKVRFFEGFRPDELRAASSLGERESVLAGTRFIDQGRVADSCYVIVEGTAAVYMQDEFVASVGPGSMAGEMALLERQPRNASVVAETDLTVVAYGTKGFNSLLSASQNASDKVAALLDSRLKANQVRLETSD